MVNNVALEEIVRLDRTAGSLVTLAQVLFISCEGLLMHLTFNRRRADEDESAPSRKPCLLRVQLQPRRAPFLLEPHAPWYRSWRTYACMGALQFVTSVLNNEVFRYHIQMPIHMVFRSSSPVTNILLGALLFGKRYDWLQIVAAALITVGATFATLASFDGLSGSFAGSSGSWWEFSVGLALLSAATCLGSLLGSVQEAVFQKYGKAERECVFYSHLLSLPLFVSRFPQMVATLLAWSASTDRVVIVDGLLEVHALYFWLAVNVLSQYMCIHGVFLVLARTDVLTLSLILALRKFVSLLLSVWLFNNPFTAYHQLAAVLVFGGSLVYSFRAPIQRWLSHSFWPRLANLILEHED